MLAKASEAPFAAMYRMVLPALKSCREARNLQYSELFRSPRGGHLSANGNHLDCWPVADPERRSVHSVLPGMQLGNYRVLRLLGEGGMGAVYAGQHKSLGKMVAIKTLHSHLARQEGVRSRFVREGQSAARIVHPNIVDVYDVGEEDEVPYLVMEYLEGRPLSYFMREKKPLPAERAADFVLPAIAAVAAAHRSGIVHRDLKPDNIFICEESGGEKPKVLDFGISKLIDGETAHGLTDTSALLGTPYYMSPEQSRTAKAAGPASDQFSLGVILYELTTGTRPFEGESLLALLQSISSCTFAPPSAIYPRISPNLEKVILRAMSKEARDRYLNLTEFGQALLPFCSERVGHLYRQEFAEGPPSGFELTTMRKGVSARTVVLGSPHAAKTRIKLRSRNTVVVAALLAALVGGAGAFFLGRHSGDELVVPAVAVADSASETRSESRSASLATATGAKQKAPIGAVSNGQSPSELKGPSSVAQFEIISIPTAEVLRGSEVLGRTPLKIDRPVKDAVAELVLRAPGYLARRVTIRSDEPAFDRPIVLRKPQIPREELPGLAPR